MLEISDCGGSVELAGIVSGLLSGQSLDGLELARKTKNSRVYRSPMLGGVFVKHYRDPALRRLLKSLSKSRARAEFEALRCLHERFANPVQALAWGELRKAGLVAESVLVTGAFDQAVDLKQFSKDLQSGARSDAERRELLSRLPGLIDQLRQIHDSGVELGSNYAKNLLYRPELEPHFAWIDQPRLIAGSEPLHWSRRILELARLDKGAVAMLRPIERLRLFLHYTQNRRLRPIDRLRLKAIDRNRRNMDRQGFTRRWRHRLFDRFKATLADEQSSGAEGSG